VRSPQAKAKIMVVQDIERDDIEFISKTLGCLPIAHVDSMRPDKLGAADLVQEVDVRPRFPLASCVPVAVAGLQAHASVKR
jgi:hypothetical protein